VIPDSTFADIGEFDPKPWLGNKGVRVLDRGPNCFASAAADGADGTNLSQDSVEVGDPDLGMICGTMAAAIHQHSRPSIGVGSRMGHRLSVPSTSRTR